MRKNTGQKGQQRRDVKSDKNLKPRHGRKGYAEKLEEVYYSDNGYFEIYFS